MTKKNTFKMRKNLFIIAILIITTLTFGQKKDKVKGSKIVTTEIKKIENFESLEVSDDVEVTLIKGTQCGIEIEADDNLHDAIELSITGSILKIYATKKVISAKKFSVKVTYTDKFKSIVAMNDSKVNALSDFELDSIRIKSTDYAKLYLTAKIKNFKLEINDKSKVELNLKSEKTRINLSKNASLKALLSTTDLVFDMYQKSDATIEGDSDTLKLRLDNNANFVGKNLIVKSAEVKTEAYTNASIQVKSNIVIDAIGKSEIELYGDQKIELKQFTDSAVLKKKPLK